MARDDPMRFTGLFLAAAGTEAPLLPSPPALETTGEESDWRKEGGEPPDWDDAEDAEDTEVDADADAGKKAEDESTISSCSDMAECGACALRCVACGEQGGVAHGAGDTGVLGVRGMWKDGVRVGVASFFASFLAALDDDDDPAVAA